MSVLPQRLFAELVKVGTDHLSDISRILSYGVMELLRRQYGVQPTGVIQGLYCNATAFPGTMNVLISPGMAIRYDETDIDEANYEHPLRLISLTSPTTVLLDPGDATWSRYDVIAITDGIEDVSATMPIWNPETSDFVSTNSPILRKNKPSFLVVKGTPSANPVVPAVPAGYIPLASAWVDAGATENPFLTDISQRLGSIDKVNSKLAKTGDTLSGTLVLDADNPLQRKMESGEWANLVKLGNTNKYLQVKIEDNNAIFRTLNGSATQGSRIETGRVDVYTSGSMQDIMRINDGPGSTLTLRRSRGNLLGEFAFDYGDGVMTTNPASWAFNLIRLYQYGMKSATSGANRRGVLVPELIPVVMARFNGLDLDANGNPVLSVSYGLSSVDPVLRVMAGEYTLNFGGTLLTDSKLIVQATSLSHNRYCTASIVDHTQVNIRSYIRENVTSDAEINVVIYAFNP